MAGTDLATNPKSHACGNARQGRARRDHFFAATDQAEGIATLHSINWQETRTIITGPVSR